MRDFLVLAIAVPASPEWAAPAVTVAGAAVTGVGAVAGYLAAKREQIRNEEQVASLRAALGVRDAQDEEEVAEDDEEDISRDLVDFELVERVTAEEYLLDEMRNRAATSFKVQTDHYANALRESNMYFLLSYLVGLAGFVVTLAGIVFLLNESVHTSELAASLPAAVTTAVGLLGDAAGIFIFNQYRKAKGDSQANLQEISKAVERDKDRQMGLILSARIDNEELRDQVYADLARQAMALPPAQGPVQLPSGRAAGPGLDEGILSQRKLPEANG